MTPAAVLVLLLVFDWRFGLISLIPMAVGYIFPQQDDGDGNGRVHEAVPECPGGHEQTRPWSMCAESCGKDIPAEHFFL